MTGNRDGGPSNQSTVAAILKGVCIGDLEESYRLPFYSVNTQHLLQARDKIQGYINFSQNSTALKPNSISSGLAISNTLAEPQGLKHQW